MLPPRLPIEDERASDLRKARSDQQSALDIMKAALSPSNAMDIGGEPGSEIIPFRKRQTPPQRPRPPVQQPYRPAATDELAKLVTKSRVPYVKLSKHELHVLATETSEFGKYLNLKLMERCPDTINAIQKRAGRR